VVMSPSSIWGTSLYLNWDFEAEERVELMARPEGVKVLLLLHDGLAHDPDALASWAGEMRCVSGFFSWGSTCGTTLRKRLL
jgi:hypothetical protein